MVLFVLISPFPNRNSAITLNSLIICHVIPVWAVSSSTTTPAFSSTSTSFFNSSTLDTVSGIDSYNCLIILVIFPYSILMQQMVSELYPYADILVT